MLDFWTEAPWFRFRPDRPEDSTTDLPTIPVIRPSLAPGLLGIGGLGNETNDNGGELFGSAGNQTNPFDLRPGRAVAPFGADRGLLLPRSAPLLFPGTEAPGLLGLGLRRLAEEPRPEGDGRGQDGAEASPFVGSPSFAGMYPESAVYPETFPVYEPAFFLQEPRDRLREASDQTERADVGRHVTPVSAFDRINFIPVSPPVDAGVGRDGFPTNSATFDPQFIMPVGGPSRRPVRPGDPAGVEPPLVPLTPLAPRPRPGPPPVPGEPPFAPRNLPPLAAPRPRGIGDNGGPRLDSVPPSQPAIPSQPTPATPPVQRSVGTEPPPKASRLAVSAEQRSDERQAEHPLPRTAEAWFRIVKVRGEEAPSGQYEGPDGRHTAVGVRLHPDLPDPVAGRDYDPTQPHLHNGYRGELELANRIKAALPDEIVLHYGMRAGLRGPDVISVSPDGDITIWDSKWRGQPTSIGEGAAGHQRPKSLEGVLEFVERQIEDAIGSGRLPEAVARKVSESARNGNVFINTVGTGKAHGGVVRCVRNKLFVDCWSQ